MKKLIIVYAVIIVIVIILAFARGSLLSFIPSFGGSQSTAEIAGEKYNLLIAKSDEERQKGLSGRGKLNEDQGMLFIFDEKGKYPFWMKDMKFAIDIIWIDDNQVVYVVRNAKPPEGQAPALTVHTPDADANFVLELNAGEAERLKIEKGTTIKFDKLPETEKK